MNPPPELARHRIAVITPSLPERTVMREEAAASVSRQTFRPRAHLVGIDHQGIGPAEMRNHLAAAAPWADWYALLDDDDFFYSDHLDRLVRWHNLGDVIYSWPDTQGQYDYVFHRDFDADLLTHHSYIGCAALVRAETWRSMGGFRDVDNEDWDFWLRALAIGATFVCVQKITWRFRLHNNNRFSG